MVIALSSKTCPFSAVDQCWSWMGSPLCLLGVRFFFSKQWCYDFGGNVQFIIGWNLSIRRNKQYIRIPFLAYELLIISKVWRKWSQWSYRSCLLLFKLVVMSKPDIAECVYSSYFLRYRSADRLPSIFRILLSWLFSLCRLSRVHKHRK